MSFMIKKKKYKFQVDFLLDELSSVPFLKGILFSKIRLLDGGNFIEMSQREAVQDHCVKWGSQFSFCCKMTANAYTGILETCICRVSVRKEVKGGRSFQKLGFADVNLAEFAGAGTTTRRYLLEGYDTKHRQDNSMLKVTLGMTLLSGDPCFKAPIFNQPTLLPENPEEQLHANKKGEDYSGDSVASGSSGFGSLPRKHEKRPCILNSELVSVSGKDGECKEENLQADCESGHSRNSSYASQHSRGYGSLCSHSRQSSAESGHFRNLSTGSAFSDFTVTSKLIDRKRPAVKVTTEENRMDSTRVDPDLLTDELIEATNLEEDLSPETSGLRLYINKDGTAALGSHDPKSTNISSGFGHSFLGQR
ncbi:early estrogen-induced gene 1 protein [Centruroides vittatus]|uniref:early estrogen-induced gene 1 protein n=1 Tax=Centruroides vittatus TaxID=120091 RepID=UPI00350F6A39